MKNRSNKTTLKNLKHAPKVVKNTEITQLLAKTQRNNMHLYMHGHFGRKLQTSSGSVTLSKSRVGSAASKKKQESAEGVKL